jgi:glycyl-tRNA synthetase beta chain
VANIETPDDGALILAGNRKVLGARLSDARFFWENDLRTVKAKGLEGMAAPLANVTFHNKLGSQGDRIARIEALAREIAPLVGAQPDLAAEAARICKADLASEMVYEFPELQGIMGKYYAEAAGLPAEVAAACPEHYSPLGPSDAVPTAPVSVAVALADKIDTLTGFWAIDEKPTGSKDPYALRRAALGVIRLVLGNGVRVRLIKVFQDGFVNSILVRDLTELPFDIEGKSLIGDAYKHVMQSLMFLGFAWPHIEASEEYSHFKADLAAGFLGLADGAEQREVAVIERIRRIWQFALLNRSRLENPSHCVRYPGERAAFEMELPEIKESATDYALDLLSFLHDRLKVFLRDEGIRHDVIDAVLAMPGNDDLTLLVARARALSEVLKTDDGENLIQAFRRANNILTQAQAQDGVEYSYGPDLKFAETDEERALFAALDTAEAKIAAAMPTEDFTAAMQAMAALRGPVDAFFEAVQVNTDNQTVRRNRLNLLHRICQTCLSVADLSRIEG